MNGHADTHPNADNNHPQKRKKADCEDERDRRSILNEKERRILLAGIFVNEFHCNSNENEWGGINEIITKLKTKSGYHHRSDIRHILRACVRCKVLNEKYDGETMTPRTGQCAILILKSDKGKIVAKHMSRGVSQSGLCTLVLEHWRQNELPAHKANKC